MSDLFHPFRFLSLKIYKTTFLLYLLTVLFFFTGAISILYLNIRNSAVENYYTQTSACFDSTEQQLNHVTTSIDNFFIRLYENPALQKDFFYFFGASPEDYANSLLDTSGSRHETILESCHNLVSDSKNYIRHIIYYSTNNITDMEYNDLGYSRYRIIYPDTAASLCETGFTYTVDVLQSAAYLGKVTFVIDLPSMAAAPCDSYKDYRMCVIINDTQFLPVHDADPAEFQALRHSNASHGLYNQSVTARKPFLYAIHDAKNFPYSVAYIAPARSYLIKPLRNLALVVLIVFLVFIFITLIYIRQFSRDAVFIQAILNSMNDAQASNFKPINIGTRKDEFADIAEHLNSLYGHLQTLIQQKYVLTIQQQRTEMQMLNAQLNPHFLYNTLERIRLRALRDNCPVVAEATADLGLLYRNIVKTDPIIPISRELEITTQYLDLMNFLYNDQLVYHCEVEEELLSLSTPKIWMQPLVENFFKHNFQNDDKIKVIVISASRSKENIEFRFFDNLGHLSSEQLAKINAYFTDPPDSSPSDGLGLKNVYERLRLHYQSRVRMSIYNNEPSGVCIQILIEGEGNTNVPFIDC